MENKIGKDQEGLTRGLWFVDYTYKKEIKGLVVSTEPKPN